MQRIQQWVDAFAPYGLEVHVWGVPRAKDTLDIPKEAEKFVRAATVPGVKFLLLNAVKPFKKRTPLDKLYRHVADDGVTSLEDMAKIGQGEGFMVRRFQYLDGDEALHELRGLLQQNIPVVVQVNYAKWDEITGNNYTGVQFVLAVGCDDAHIFVHDPLFRGARRNRGAHFVWRNQRFLEGWGNLHELDGQDFVALTLDKQVARR